MSIRLRTMVALLGVALLARSATLLPAGEKKPDDKKPANFYPIKTGNVWHFTRSVNGNDDKMVNRIAKVDTVDGVAIGRLEASLNGAVVATEALVQNDKGIFRHRFNDKKVDPPLPLLRYPAKSGDKWEGEFKVDDNVAKYEAVATEEEVKVPAGKFKAMKVVINVTEGAGTVSVSYWFVNDVGFVRQTVEAGNLSIVMELDRREEKQ